MASSHWGSRIGPESGTRLLELEVTGGDLNEIKAQDFHGVRGLKRLDLSENQLERIANDAFEEVYPVYPANHDRALFVFVVLVLPLIRRNYLLLLN